MSTVAANAPLPIVAGASDILTAARALRSGESNVSALVEAALRRIATFDERIHAWVSVDTIGARAAAVALAEEARRGAWRGPLHGIPLGIKDIVDVVGWPTQAGSPIRASHMAARDATIVERLRAAGAIILGKTVTTEFASFDPPPTLNPWNQAHTPGGSSSGSVAAVALGMCAAAIGSQTGGSITRPATYCGVAGLKPTIGRVSVDGVLPVSFHLDHPGPIARHVADLALVFQAIAGPDPRDPLCSDVPVADYVAALAQPRPPRLGLVEPFFLELCDAPTRNGILALVERFRSAGAEVVAAALPESFADVLVMHRKIMAVEAAEVHHRDYPARREFYGPHITELIEEGLATSARDYTSALRHRHVFQSHLRPLLAAFDALLTPATLSAAPARLDTTGDPRFNSPWSFAGVPTASLPTRLDEQGMPLGIQLVGGAFEEARLLATAAWCESVIGFSAEPPMLNEMAHA